MKLVKLCAFLSVIAVVVFWPRTSRKFYLAVYSGKGLNAGVSRVDCDSFQMQGTKKAIIWVDGTKMQVEAETLIRPHTR